MLLLLSIFSWLLVFKLSGFSKLTFSKANRGGGGGVQTQTFYNYSLLLSYQSVDPNYPILVYDAYGNLVYTVNPGDSNMNYGTGIYTVPGSAENATIDSVSTATFFVSYPTSDVTIDYTNALFYISETIIPEPTSVTVWATFDYITRYTPTAGLASILANNYDNSLVTTFFAPPPQDYPYAIIDLGSVQTIQELDITCGYFEPDAVTKFNVSYSVTVQYSLDNVNYFDIGTDLVNVAMKSGNTAQFDEKKLGSEFQTRYILILLESVDKIDYSSVQITVTSDNYQTLVNNGIIDPNYVGHAVVGDIIVLRDGLWVVAVCSASAYSDIVIRSDGKLIPTTLSVDLQSGNTVIVVNNTSGFSSSGTAYLNKDAGQMFTYTSITPTEFRGVDLLSGCEFTDGCYVTSSIITDSTLYDNTFILPKQGDRVYKNNLTSTPYLYQQSDLDSLAQSYLSEYIKNLSKVQIDLLFAPYWQVGQTANLTDVFEGLNDNRYFVESITHTPKNTRLVVAQYPPTD